MNPSAALTADSVTRTRGPIWDPSKDIVATPDQLLYEVAADGDAYISVPKGLGRQVLIRVSTEALAKNTGYFRAGFGAAWMPTTGMYTKDHPLVIPQMFDHFVVFLHIASGDDTVPRPADHLLRPVAVTLDRYLFDGELPDWVEETLMSWFPKQFPFDNDVGTATRTLEDTGILPETCSTSILHMAYLLELPSVFAIASRRMMWQLSFEEVDTLLPEHLQDLMPCDFVECFKKEALRLRVDLVSKLPHVFHPDAHCGDGDSGDGDDDHDHQWWCKSCHTVPHEQRWMQEVINKSDSWKAELEEGPVERLGDLFMEYLRDMNDLDRPRVLDVYEYTMPCGKFRFRFTDVNDHEMLFDVYTAIGGLCLHCIKAGGEFKYRRFCDIHDLDLCKE